MTTLTNTHAGVMDAGYADVRRGSCVLRFRYQTRAEVVVRAVEQFLPAGVQRLLDIGAAEGRSLSYTAERLGSGKYVGVEYSDELRQAASDLPPTVRLIRGDAVDLPESLANDSFDVVSMLAVLEHVDDPQRALGEAQRVVKPGGIVVASSPNPIWDDVAGKLGLIKDEYHVERLDLARLSQLFVRAGLEIFDGGRFMWAPVASLPYLRIPVPPRLSLAVDRIVDRIPLVRSLCVNSFVVGRKMDSTGPT